MLRIIAAESGNNKHADEAAHLRQQIEFKLTEDAVIDGVKTRAVRYCNKRYWIPFGWFVCHRSVQISRYFSTPFFYKK